MDNLNKFGLLCVVMVFFVAGCGKKTEKTHTHSKGAKNLVSSNEIPVLKEETENFLEDSDIADFAFVDDEDTAEATKSAVPLVADNDDEDDTLVETDQDLASSYSFKTVHFDFNKNDIRRDQRPVLQQDVQVAQQAVEQGKDVVVEGHCCPIGSAAYNLALSQRRAEIVKKEMVKNGVPADHVKTLGYGFERPVVWSDASNRSQLIKELAPNRRAEVVVN